MTRTCPTCTKVCLETDQFCPRCRTELGDGARPLSAAREPDGRWEDTAGSRAVLLVTMMAFGALCGLLSRS
jgi:hypothetical protein